MNTDPIPQQAVDASRSDAFLCKVLLGLNCLAVATALISGFVFESSWALELLIWFLACEVLLCIGVFLPVFLFQLVWRRQDPRVAFQRSLEAFVDAIAQLKP